MLPRLHLVTDDAVLGRPRFAEDAGKILRAHGAAVAVHLRGHGVTGARLWSLAVELVPVAAAAGAAVLVNDRIDIARAAGAHGAQIGARSLPVAAAREILGPEPVIGYSAHDDDEAEAAAAEGADFVLLGTIFASTSHPHRPAAGLEAVRGAAARVSAPVLAIGGVGPERVQAVVAAGAYGVAALGGVWHTQDPASAACEYLAHLPPPARTGGDGGG